MDYSNNFSTIPFPKDRKATVDVLNAAKRKNMIHSLIEVDITLARANIKITKHKEKQFVSLIGYLIFHLARVVEEDRILHAYRNWKGKLILFKDVDISTTIERKINDKFIVIPKIIRAANSKSAFEISEEIMTAKQENVNVAEVYRSMRMYLAIPFVIRGFVFRILDRFPLFMKKKAGTVMFTSAGLATTNPGWGIPIASHTLNVSVGSVFKKSIFKNNSMEEREFICLTISFDHDIIDGAPAARFVRSFTKRLESGKL